MILGILSVLAGITGMVFYGYALGPLAVLLGVIGLILSFKVKGAPLAMNILGLIFGAAAFVLSPFPGNTTIPVAETPPAGVATPPAAPQETDQDSENHREAAQSDPAPIADPSNPGQTIEPQGEIIEVLPDSIAKNSIFMGDVEKANMSDIILSFGPENPATQTKPVYIEVTNNTNFNMLEAAVVIGLKDGTLWPAELVQKLSRFEPLTLNPKGQIMFNDVPFKNLYQIPIGELPQASRRKVTLNLHTFDESRFVGNIFFIRKLKGDNIPLSWLISGTEPPVGWINGDGTPK
jgi:hypothetical protein